jgi:hypothetical protein
MLITGGDKSDSLQQTDYPALELIIAEAGAAAINRGAERARSEVLIFLSGELKVEEAGWLREVVSQVVRPDIGAVGARLWSPAGTLEDGGLILGLGGLAAPAFRGIPRGHPGYFNRAWLQQNYSAVSATCMAVRKSVFFDQNGFDEKTFPFHFYDIDFCLRLGQRGLQVIWTPYANLIFSGSGSREEGGSSDEGASLRERWGPRLEQDPSYNPNLSLNLPGFHMAIPPRPNDHSLE